MKAQFYAPAEAVAAIHAAARRETDAMRDCNFSQHASPQRAQVLAFGVLRRLYPGAASQSIARGLGCVGREAVSIRGRLYTARQNAREAKEAGRAFWWSPELERRLVAAASRLPAVWIDPFPERDFVRPGHVRLAETAPKADLVWRREFHWVRPHVIELFDMPRPGCSALDQRRAGVA